MNEIGTSTHRGVGQKCVLCLNMFIILPLDYFDIFESVMTALIKKDKSSKIKEG